jgi:glycosyltransferase A (GT-A) superfamily protein (DUF2064 family)
MSKRTQMLLLGATLAAINLAGMTSVALAQPEAHDAIKRAVAQQHAADQATTEELIQQALAQERYYSTQGTHPSTSAVPSQPATASSWPGRVVLALGGGVLAAGLVLLTLAAARRGRRVRAEQGA